VKPEGEDFGEDSSPESGKDSCEWDFTISYKGEVCDGGLGEGGLGEGGLGLGGGRRRMVRLSCVLSETGSTTNKPMKMTITKTHPHSFPFLDILISDINRNQMKELRLNCLYVT
jgi:hypothetical protein